MRTVGMAALALYALAILGYDPSARADAPASVEEGDATPLEEVLVTSRKVPENLQTAGASIEVFSSQRLEDLGIAALTDLTNYAPNVIIESKSGSDSLGLSIKIRGIGVSDVDYLYSDPSVAVYIDGVFQPRVEGIQSELFDLDRVEMLRGPQGTLYGKNALGGAINLITRKPDATESAQADLTVGNYGELDFRGGANTVLVDQSLFANLSVVSINHDGYYKNTFETDSDPSDGDRIAARGALRWLPSDNVTVDLVLSYGRQRQTAPTFWLEAIAPGSLTAAALTAAGYSPANFVVGSTPSPGQLAKVALDNGANAGSFLPSGTGADGRSIDDAEYWDESLVATANLTPDTTFHAIAGYHDFDSSLARDLDGTPAAISDQVYSSDGHSFTSEVQLTQALLDNRGTLVLGAFGLSEMAHENEANDFLLGLAATTPALQQIDRREIRIYDNSSAAGYLHALFKATDALGFTAGVRYSWEKKVDHEIDSNLVTAAVSANDEISRTWGSTTPQFGVEYALTPDVFSYATIAKGYASGGYSSAISGVGLQQYNPESLWNYEAGLKTEWLDHTLRLNASVFFMDYQNIVIQSFEAAANGTPINVYSNAGKAHVSGLDSDIEWVPLPHLQLTTGVGLLDQRFLQYGIGANGQPILAATAHFFDSPSVTLNSTIQYSLPVFGHPDALTAEVSGAYRTRTYFDNDNAITSSQNPYTIYNGQMTYQLPTNHLFITLFCKNMTNVVYVTRTANALSSLGFAVVTFGPPRTYGATLKYRL
jgi:iron complex outermembrane recepter protein